MTKTTSAGIVVSPATGRIVSGYTRDGTQYYYAPTTSASVEAAVNRKTGEDASLLSFTGRDGAFRPCTHTRKRWIAHPTVGPDNMIVRSGNTSTSPSAIIYGQSIGLSTQLLNRNYVQFSAEALKVPSVAVQWDALATQALATMLPSITTDNSLLNFLVELKDFKRLKRALMQSSPLDYWINTVKTAFGQRDMDKPLARVAKFHLSVEFAWRPLIRDITRMYQDLTSLDKRIRDVIRRADTPQQRYYGTDLGAAPGTSVPWQSAALGFKGGSELASYLSNLGKSRVSVYEDLPPRYHATVRYRYPVPPVLRTEAGRCRALLDTLGLNANPATIWNAIPFTFLIDWFVNVGGFLKGFRYDNVPIQSEITDFCHSVKIRRRTVYEQQMRHWTGTTWTYGPWYATDECVYSQYTRHRTIPNLYGALLTSGLSGREAVLSAALITANVKSRR